MSRSNELIHYFFLFFRVTVDYHVRRHNRALVRFDTIMRHYAYQVMRLDCDNQATGMKPSLNQLMFYYNRKALNDNAIGKTLKVFGVMSLYPVSPCFRS